MKILVVTDVIPFPPYNGRQLPLAKIFSELSLRHTVHLLIVNSGAAISSEALKQAPLQIKFIGAIEAKRNKSFPKIFTAAFASYDYSLREISNATENEHYDYIWISPVTHYAFAVFCRENGLHFFDKVAIGLNDSKTFQYRDSMNEMLHSKIFNLRSVTDWLRSFMIAGEEKKYIGIADIVHVQTSSEENKLKKLVSAADEKKIIAAPNGVKEELFACRYNSNSSFILYMTHLDGDRMQESKWFLQKVWPKIKLQIPGAKLIIAGKPPSQPIPMIDNDTNIIINGYSENLLALYEKVRLAVVPTFHGTGLINRILDALTAGVPVVTTPQAAATFPGLQNEKEILAAQTPGAFMAQIKKIFSDDDICQCLSYKGRAYAKKFPVWQQTAAVIEKAMVETLNEK